MGLVETLQHRRVGQLLVRLPEIHAIQKHAQLIDRDFSCRFFVSRPGEVIALQALLPQTESVAVSVHRFQESALVIAEQVQVP